MAKSIFILYAVSHLLSLVCGHIEMTTPYAFKSKFNQANLGGSEGEVDYSNTSPLAADGSNFPCKGYQINNPSIGYDQANVVVKNYTAGSSYVLSLAGTATHGGGSCQISLSYDNGQTFKVIKSFIGGCPLGLSFPFTIPSFAPASGSALFAWSWFNTVGNREMYMDCARVAIQSSGFVGRHRRTSSSTPTSLSDLPSMFACNVGNGCTSIEYEDVQFPDPGSDVVYGTDSVQTYSGIGFFVISSSTTSSTTSLTASTQSSTITTTTLSSTTGAPYGNTSTRRTTSVSTSTTTTLSPSLTSTTPLITPSSILSSTAPSASTTLLSGPCTVGSIACNSPTAFSMCINNATGSTSYQFMGNVAAGMQCVDGNIIRQNAGSCSGNGQIVCKGSTAWYMCVDGGLIDMGSVAPGTKCLNGALVAI